MRNISNKNFITEGDKSLSRQLRRRAEKEIARIDELHVNDTNRHYIKKIFIAHGTWIEYKHFSDDQIKVTIHTPTGETNLDPINGLASGTRYFIKPSGGFGRFFDRDEGLIYPKKVTDSIHPWLYSPPAIGAVDVFMKTPGKYTGEMRKVIQALIATGQYLYYEYKAGLCHGVYTADNDSKWIIEISAQGIFASPMPLTEEPDAHTAWLGYSPLGPTDDDLNFKRIAGSAVVAPFFSKTPVFNACGWAFNSTGSAIKNCCTTGGTGAGIATGFLYSITVSETDGIPDNATMSLEESGQFALPRYSGMKVPDYTETGLAQTSHQDGQSDTLVFSGPRYVFFDGDVEKIVRSKGSGNVIDNNLPLSLPWRDDDGGRVQCASQPTGAYVCWPVYMIDYTNHPRGYTAPLGGSVTENNIGTVVDGFNTSPNVSTTGDVWEESAELDPDPKGNVVADRSAPYWNVYKMHALRTQTTSSYRGHVSYCIIPLGDREAVYQYQWDSRISGYEYEAWDGTGWDGGSCNFKYSETGNCKEVSVISPEPGNIVGFGNARQYSDFGMPVVDQDWCNYRSGWQDHFYWKYAQNATPPVYSAKLSIVASGNIDELLWSDSSINTGEVSYNSDPSPEAPQWMYVHRDNTQNGKVFGAKYMNATTYSKQFIIGIDETKYPMASLPNFTINTFWVGDPHCVNNDCEE